MALNIARKAYRRFISKRRGEIILHAGLPKTGSSALQSLLYENRENLASVGVLYPGKVVNENNTKHQWLAQGLLSGNTSELDEVLGGCFNYKRVILSTESLTNDLYNFNPEYIRRFSERISLVADVTVCLVDRDPNRWAASYYKQSIVNPPVARMPFYSTSKTFNEFIKEPIVSRLMDRKSLFDDLGRLFSAEVKVFDYDSASIGDIAEWCTGVKVERQVATPTKNDSLPDCAAELLRQLNGMVESPAEKFAWCSVLSNALDVSSSTLKRLSQRATHESIQILKLSKLDKIKSSQNPPLRFWRGQMEELIVSMKESAQRLKSNGR